MTNGSQPLNDMKKKQQKCTKENRKMPFCLTRVLFVLWNCSCINSLQGMHFLLLFNSPNSNLIFFKSSPKSIKTIHFDSRPLIFPPNSVFNILMILGNYTCNYILYKYLYIGLLCPQRIQLSLPKWELCLFICVLNSNNSFEQMIMTK